MQTYGLTSMKHSKTSEEGSMSRVNVPNMAYLDISLHGSMLNKLGINTEANPTNPASWSRCRVEYRRTGGARLARVAARNRPTVPAVVTASNPPDVPATPSARHLQRSNR
ncbi:hypothetical protein EYF80_046453 [Liparis tanakae]|uniref:Uncharacterized protein n=1 Tax=Liparis tanakae TaxID=230148 RepID=A0A4Z2FR19_9TELE|nr:hypothetical protein EYF80_046453 [Liparis tanakae]